MFIYQSIFGSQFDPGYISLAFEDESGSEFDLLVQSYLRQRHYSSSRQAVFNLIYAMINVGLVALPATAKFTGIIFYIIAICLFSVCTSYTTKMLIQIAHENGLRTLEDVGEKAFGRPGFLIVCACQCLFSVSLICITLVVWTDIVSDIVLNFSHTLPFSPFLLRCVVASSGSVVVFPLCAFVRSMTNLNFVSYTAAAFICLSLLSTIIALSTNKDYVHLSSAQAWATLLPQSEWWCFPLFLTFCFSYHQKIFAVYGCLRHRTPQKWSVVVTRAHFAIAFIYLFFGIFGYLSTLRHVSSSHLLLDCNYFLQFPTASVNRQAYLDVFRGVLALCLLLTIPIDALVAVNTASRAHARLFPRGLHRALQAAARGAVQWARGLCGWDEWGSAGSTDDTKPWRPRGHSSGRSDMSSGSGSGGDGTNEEVREDCCDGAADSAKTTRAGDSFTAATSSIVSSFQSAAPIESYKTRPQTDDMSTVKPVDADSESASHPAPAPLSTVLNQLQHQYQPMDASHTHTPEVTPRLEQGAGQSSTADAVATLEGSPRTSRFEEKRPATANAPASSTVGAAATTTSGTVPAASLTDGADYVNDRESIYYHMRLQREQQESGRRHVESLVHTGTLTSRDLHGHTMVSPLPHRQHPSVDTVQSHISRLAATQTRSASPDTQHGSLYSVALGGSTYGPGTAYGPGTGAGLDYMYGPRVRSGAVDTSSRGTSTPGGAAEDRDENVLTPRQLSVGHLMEMPPRRNWSERLSLLALALVTLGVAVTLSWAGLGFLLLGPVISAALMFVLPSLAYFKLGLSADYQAAPTPLGPLPNQLGMGLLQAAGYLFLAANIAAGVYTYATRKDIIAL